MDQQWCFVKGSLGSKSLFEILTFFLFPNIEMIFLTFAKRQRSLIFFRLLLNFVMNCPSEKRG